jgi:hypothetical protein
LLTRNGHFNDHDAASTNQEHLDPPGDTQNTTDGRRPAASEASANRTARHRGYGTSFCVGNDYGKGLTPCTGHLDERDAESTDHEHPAPYIHTSKKMIAGFPTPF